MHDPNFVGLMHCLGKLNGSHGSSIVLRQSTYRFILDLASRGVEQSRLALGTCYDDCRFVGHELWRYKASHRSLLVTTHKPTLPHVAFVFPGPLPLATIFQLQ